MRSELIIKALILPILLSFVFTANAQFRADAIDIKTSYGVIMPHHKSFYYFLNGRIPTIAVTVNTITNGEQEWLRARKNPTFGFGFFYSDLKNKTILGQAYALYMNYGQSIFKYKQTGLQFSMSGGVAYLNKIFDPINNPYNIAVSSHLNAYLNPSLDFYYKNKALKFSTGLALTHLSNGGFKKPNSGLNHVGIHFGLSAQISKHKKTADKAIVDTVKYLKSSIFTVITSYGKRQKSINGNIYSVVSIMFDYIYRPKIRYGYGIGADMFYDFAIADVSPIDTILGTSKRTAFYNGLHLTWVGYYGNFYSSLQFGFYVYGSPDYSEKTYMRIAFRYSLNPKFDVGIGLKTYFGVAHFSELGLGYSIHRINKHKT